MSAGEAVSVPLARLGEVITGATPPANHAEWFAPAGMPFITPSDMGDGERSVTTERFLSPAGVAGMSKRVIPAGAVCFVSIGSTIGKMCSTPVPSVTNQQINALVVDPTQGDPTYVYYALAQMAPYLRAIAGGSATPILNKSSFSSVELEVLPVEEQRRVGGLLDALDDKIESDRRLVKLIPSLIRARVLIAMEAGSKASPVSSLATFINGGAYTNGASGTGRMVIRIAELNGGPGGSTVYNDIDVPEHKTARPGDILMSWSGSLGVYRWTRDEAIINQHIFKVIPHGFPDWLVFDRVDAVIDEFKGIAKDKATTMGHIQRGHLDSTLVDLPAPEAIRDLDLVVGQLWDRLLLAEREILTLAALREALLPGLLAGMIRVPFDRDPSDAFELEHA